MSLCPICKYIIYLNKDIFHISNLQLVADIPHYSQNKITNRTQAAVAILHVSIGFICFYRETFSLFVCINIVN